MSDLYLHEKIEVHIIMERIVLIPENKNSFMNSAVDGLLYGIAGGVAMFLCLAAFALLSGDRLGALLERFGASSLTPPVQGLLSHLAVSAVYGVLFGRLVWPVLRHYSQAKITGWLGGLAYAILLLLLAQTAILPAIGSPLLQLPFWQWSIAHGLYGLVLGSLFAQKAV